MKHTHFAAVCSLLLTLFFSPDKTSAQNSEPWQQAERFMKIFDAEGYEPFVDSMFGNAKWIEKSTVTKLKLNGVEFFTEATNGQYYGNTFMSEVLLNDRLASVTYLARWDRTPVAFIFIFYRPGEHWKLYSFKFSSETLMDDLEIAESWHRRSNANTSSN